MSYATIAVANSFIRRGLEGKIPNLDPMKLQKLIFFAHSWHLAIHDEPLIDDFFSKWPYGPVIPSLYHTIKSYGRNNITKYLKIMVDNHGTIAAPIVPDNDKDVNDLLDRISYVYGSHKSTDLSALTHLPGSAWDNTPLDGAAITDETMKEAILKQWEKNRENQ
jgi:uncharacterized phage-associated protein